MGCIQLFLKQYLSCTLNLAFCLLKGGIVGGNFPFGTSLAGVYGHRETRSRSGTKLLMLGGFCILLKAFPGSGSHIGRR